MAGLPDCSQETISVLVVVLACSYSYSCSCSCSSPQVTQKGIVDNSLEVDEAIVHAHPHLHPYVEWDVDVHSAFQNLVPAWGYDGEVTTWKYYVVIGMEVDGVGTVEEVLRPARLLSLSSQLLVEM